MSQEPQLPAATTTELQEQSCEPSTVTEIVLTDMDTHPPPATAPQLTVEGPPLYPDSISVPQTSTYPPTAEPQPAIVHIPQLTVEEPPPYPDNTNVPQYHGKSMQPPIPQPPPVTIVTTQPQRVARHRRARGPVENSNSILALSVCLCIVCCLLGSPITVVCFIPAICLAVKINNYNEYGEYDKARNASISAYVLNLVGFLIGLIFFVLAIVYEVIN